MRSAALLVACCGVAALAGCRTGKGSQVGEKSVETQPGAAMSKDEARAKVHRVHVLGDSISKHYGPFLESALRGSFGVTVNWGGGDSVLVLETLRRKLEEGGIDADVMLLNCGLHDIKTDPETGQRQVELEAYRRNLTEIVGLARRTKPELVWMRTTPLDDARHNRPGAKFHRHLEDCRAYNAAADEIMAGAGAPILDLHTFTLNLGADLYRDHVHFRDEICRQQAAFLAGWLTRWRDERVARRPSTGTRETRQPESETAE